MQRRIFLSGVLVALVGCKPREARYPLPRVVNLYIVVSAQVAKQDNGNVSGMVDVIEQELRDAGYEVNIVAARDDEKPPSARLELQVVTSDQAAQRAMAGGQLANLAVTPLGGNVIVFGGGGIVVDVYFVPWRG